MQPTVQTVWRAWAPGAHPEGPRLRSLGRGPVGRLRAQLRDLSLGLRLAFSNSDFTFYTADEERQIIRLQAELRKAHQSKPPTRAPREWAPHIAPWQLPDLAQVQLRTMSAGGNSAVSSGPGGGPPALGPAPPLWWGGLPLGALLLALLVMLLRAADRCLHRVALKLSRARRQSEEWPTPVVLATSHIHEYSTEAAPPSPGGPHESPPADLPPPYSECLSGGPLLADEPPPPPYSACYVAFTNAKGAPPAVTIHDSRHRGLFGAGPSDTGQGDLGGELIENGKVLEKPAEEPVEVVGGNPSSPEFLA